MARHKQTYREEIPADVQETLDALDGQAAELVEDLYEVDERSFTDIRRRYALDDDFYRGVRDLHEAEVIDSYEMAGMVHYELTPQGKQAYDAVQQQGSPSSLGLIDRVLISDMDVGCSGMAHAFRDRGYETVYIDDPDPDWIVQSTVQEDADLLLMAVDGETDPGTVRDVTDGLDEYGMDGTITATAATPDADVRNTGVDATFTTEHFAKIAALIDSMGADGLLDQSR